jgi:putative transcriptional regulator
MDINQRVSATITKLRKQHGYSQKELADEAGIHVNTMISLESGRYDTTLPILLKITSVFGMQLGRLILLIEEEE